MARIRIVCEAAGVELAATLNDSQTSRELLGILPVEGEAQRWGDEVYFAIPLELGAESPVETVAVGDLGYWPPGSAFCVFFGQQPYSAVNPLGSVEGDARALTAVGDGDLVRLEEAEPDD